MWKPTTEKELSGLKEVGSQRMSFESIDDIIGSDELCALLGDWARTWHEEDRPLGVVGAWPAWNGVAIVWALLTDEIIDRPLSLCKGAHRWMDYIVKRENIHRLQTLVQPEHDAAQRWAHWLGFQREGLMERASPQGTDLWLYARIF